MQIALAQLNPLVGDLAGNGEAILAATQQAGQQAAGESVLVVTPELSLWGYPPRDLLLRPSLLELQPTVLDRLAAGLVDQPPGLRVLVGVAEPSGSTALPCLYNAAALIEAGCWRIVCRKRLLPSYDVFDERRYFKPADQAAVLELREGERHWRLGLTICEDLWVEEELQGQRLAGSDPIAELLPLGIDALLNLSASPFGHTKLALRHHLAHRAAERLGCPVVYVNQVGGNDDLVFDGASFVKQPSGATALHLACSRPQVGLWALSAPKPAAPAPAAVETRELPSDPEQMFRALVLGVSDYAQKCGFKAALLGLSGGIDSALVAAIAAAALGGEQVQALLMPSPYSSSGSIDDAVALAQRLGLRTATLPIEALMQAFDQTLAPGLGAIPSGLAAENLQSRIRGTLLMAMANQQGQLLLSTGNKSELAVGSCTLYGDMNGGLAVIGDLYKSTVFELCAWLDSDAAGPTRQDLGLRPSGELVGDAIRHKAPSAELRPEQKDSDSLPDYAVLDPMLKALIEDLRSPEELVAAGADAALAARVMGLLRRAEFKRRQAPPVLKVSRRSFGTGWRMPIAAR